MSDMTRIDRMVWRINGWLILATMSLVGLLALYGVYQAVTSSRRVRQRHDLVNVNPQTSKKERLYLGRFDQVTGHRHFVCPLYSDQRYNLSYYSKSASAVRNYLFYDADAGASSWLLNSHDMLVLDKQELSDEWNNQDPVLSSRRRAVSAFAFVIVPRDTNGDHVIDADDQKQVMLTDNRGGHPTVLLEAVNEVLGIEQASEEVVIMFYQAGDKSAVIEVNYKTGQVVRRSDLSLDPSKPVINSN